MLRLLPATLLLALLNSSFTFGDDPTDASGETAKMDLNSPLLKPWTGPYGGVPPWTLVRTEEFSPAFEVAIARASDDLNAIANNTEPPTFENTVLA
ncbi:MAG: M3 family peptidase, partial [Rubripirellula sp.]